MLLNRSPLHMPVYTTGIVTRSACETGEDAITARRVAYSRVCRVQIAYCALLAIRTLHLWPSLTSRKQAPFAGAIGLAKTRG